jgi:hypothetical protein
MGGAVLINVILLILLVSLSSRQDRASCVLDDGTDAYDGFGKEDYDLI